MHDRLNDGWANVDDAWWTTEAAAIIERLVHQRDESDAALVRMKAERDDLRDRLQELEIANRAGYVKMTADEVDSMMRSTDTEANGGGA
jgi:hypothetical protein